MGNGCGSSEDQSVVGHHWLSIQVCLPLAFLLLGDRRKMSLGVCALPPIESYLLCSTLYSQKHQEGDQSPDCAPETEVHTAYLWRKKSPSPVFNCCTGISSWKFNSRRHTTAAGHTTATMTLVLLWLTTAPLHTKVTVLKWQVFSQSVIQMNLDQQPHTHFPSPVSLL